VDNLEGAAAVVRVSLCWGVSVFLRLAGLGEAMDLEGNGVVSGPVRVRDQSTFHGTVMGGVVVEGELTLHGLVTGDLTVAPGGQATIHGTVRGTVVNEGSTHILGSVGDIRATSSSSTIVEAGAVVHSRTTGV
jgi:hypothetical protein